jgi:hypothetical protein
MTSSAAHTPGGGFAEYRIRTEGRVTAMCSDFDDPQEVASYPEYAEALQRAAQPGRS